MDEVKIYTYSSIRGPGKKDGAYGYILETGTAAGPATLTCFGHLDGSTENQAEITALLMAARRLTRPCWLEIYTESAHLYAGVNGWMEEWEAAGWTNKKGEPVKNRELWQQLKKALADHETGMHLKESHPYRDWLKRETERRRK